MPPRRGGGWNAIGGLSEGDSAAVEAVLNLSLDDAPGDIDKIIQALRVAQAALRYENSRASAAGERARSAAQVDTLWLLSRVHDLSRPHTSALRVAFPVANRGAVVRRLHLKGFLEKQARLAPRRALAL